MKRIAYWFTTGLIALVWLSGGIASVLQRPETVAGMQHLGYPAYFVAILGVWKILGAIALLIPGYPRLKEWAYAGTIFELTGAVTSHAVMHDETWHLVVPTIFALCAITSWALRPQSRILGTFQLRTAS